MNPRRAGEFELIARHFAPLAAAAPGAAGLVDDVALLTPPPGESLVFKTDAIVAGRHYLPDDPPDLVARKLLRVNLSDLAAKGARPLGYLLACCFPDDVAEDWIAGFARGLGQDQREFEMTLWGGDTTATPGPASFAATVIGAVAGGRVPRRSGAKPGDLVLVTGTLGDAALGLEVLKGKLRTPDDALLIERYRLPRPRLKEGRELAPWLNAAIDISDGLAADLGHVALQSGLGAEIDCARIPLSPPARAALERDPALWPLVVAGGDDYEILGTAPALLPGTTAIGRMVAGRGVAIRGPDGNPLALGKTGYRHF